jgi:hypothetical protein
MGGSVSETARLLGMWPKPFTFDFAMSGSPPRARFESGMVAPPGVRAHRLPPQLFYF